MRFENSESEIHILLPIKRHMLNRIGRNCLPVVGLSLLSLVASPKDKPEQVYPLHGTVIAMRSELHTHGAPVYTDPYGKTHGGGVHVRREYVYTVRTQQADYDIEGKHLSVGDRLVFRVDKNRVFVQTGEKERRYVLVGEEVREPVSHH